MKKKTYLTKDKKLRGYLRRLTSCVIAFSGGVDSGLLAYLAKSELGKKSICITAQSPTYSSNELAHARSIARMIGFRHQVITTAEFKNKQFIHNTKERCYWCKKELFYKLEQIRKSRKFAAVLDGTTLEDTSDHRPGKRAAQELGVKSPLLDFQFTKRDVRALARHYNLPFWNKPSGTCLSSRIPYGETITRPRIQRVTKAEDVLRNFLGTATLFRLRDHKDIARIEFAKKAIPRVVEKRGWPEVIRKLKKLGYRYITIDLEGYVPQGLRE